MRGFDGAMINALALAMGAMISKSNFDFLFMCVCVILLCELPLVGSHGVTTSSDRVAWWFHTCLSCGMAEVKCKHLCHH